MGYLFWFLLMGWVQIGIIIVISQLSAFSLYTSRALTPFVGIFQSVVKYGAIWYNFECLFPGRKTWNFTPADGWIYYLSHPYHSSAGEIFPRLPSGMPVRNLNSENYFVVVENFWRLDVNLLYFLWKVSLLILAIGVAEAILQRTFAFVFRIKPSPTALGEFVMELFYGKRSTHPDKGGRVLD